MSKSHSPCRQVKKKGGGLYSDYYTPFIHISLYENYSFQQHGKWLVMLLFTHDDYKNPRLIGAPGWKHGLLAYSSCPLLLVMALKVLANEKRGVLAVVTFDRSRFKLFSREFSNKCVLAPSCERLKTAPRTLFLSFESNNCFPITV